MGFSVAERMPQSHLVVVTSFSGKWVNNKAHIVHVCSTRDEEDEEAPTKLCTFPFSMLSMLFSGSIHMHDCVYNEIYSR